MNEVPQPIQFNRGQVGSFGVPPVPQCQTVLAVSHTKQRRESLPGSHSFALLAHPAVSAKAGKTGHTLSTRTARFPQLIVFDVDGVLVDVHESFHETVLRTVKHFTGKPVTHKQLHEWKNRPGFNDDWKLSTAWVQSLGGKQEYDEVKQKFLELYWGSNRDGLVSREKWLLARPSLQRLSKKAELGIFTGRVWDEMNHTLDRCKTREYFRTIVTAQDVSRTKPDPEGLLKVLAGRPPETAIYLGDNVDDALAAKSAGVPFVGILRRRSDERRERIDTLKQLGALTILGHVDELERWLTARR